MARKPKTEGVSKTDNVTVLHPKPREKPSAKRKVNLLSDIPAIGRYLERIGAEARSPRTATITRKVERGYEHNDIAIIKLSPDGTWHAPEALAPSDEEQEAIAKQAEDFEWPKLEKLKRPTLPKEIVAARKANPMNVFEFRDTEGHVVMCQVRVEGKDGEKRYVPWTLWDDKKWRQSEPDELLPLWGLEQLEHHSVVFLHEGAKAARHARKIASLRRQKGEPVLDNLDLEERERLLQHPWAEHLANKAHLGWIGGAPNPHRTDWSPLKRGVHQVFIVADNDIKGVDAIAKISKELGQWNVEVYSLRFDTHFPLSFDRADDFFEPVDEGKLWNQREDGTKRYIGPSFKQLLKPATWAVKELPVKADAEKKGRGRPKGPTFVPREVFRDQWAIAKEMDPVHFINRWDPTLSFREETFNRVTRPFSGPVGNLSTLMMKEGSVAIDLPSYEPGRAKGELIVRGKRTFNTWTPTLVQPVTGRHYDPKPWFGFLEHLFPVEEERKVVMRWVATLIARPDIRMTFGLLLISEHHGIGKTSLAQIVAALVGDHNVSWPNENQIVDNSFNSWLARKRLVVCSEIYSGHSWKAYNKLKDVITDSQVEVNEKFVKAYTINNYAHVILCSNSPEALKVEPDDRRIYQPEVSEKKKPPEWWRGFHAWLSGDGHGIIFEWARRHVGYMTGKGRVEKGEVNPIGPEMHPPMTEMKRRAIRAATDEDQLLAQELGGQALEMAREKGTRVILVDRQVQEWVAGKLGLKRDADDPTGRSRGAWRRSFRNVKRGLRAAGLTLVREWQSLGADYEAYGTFDPADWSEEQRTKWNLDVVQMIDLERWAKERKPM